MVESKLLIDYLCDLRKQFLQVLCLINCPRNLSDRFKLSGAVGINFILVTFWLLIVYICIAKEF